jgi:hypothetical protein
MKSTAFAALKKTAGTGNQEKRIRNRKGYGNAYLSTEIEGYSFGSALANVSL